MVLFVRSLKLKNEKDPKNEPWSDLEFIANHADVYLYRCLCEMLLIVNTFSHVEKRSQNIFAVSTRVLQYNKLFISCIIEMITFSLTNILLVFIAFVQKILSPIYSIVFSIWKLLQVLQKFRIRIMTHAIYTYLFCSYKYTLLFCWKIESSCHCRFPPQIRSQIAIKSVLVITCLGGWFIPKIARLVNGYMLPVTCGFWLPTRNQQTLYWN